MTDARETGHSIKTLRTVEEVASLRLIWEAMQKHPNTDIDSFVAIVECRGEIVRPHVIVMFAGERAVAMAIGRIENIRIDCHVGYKTVFAPKARSLTFVYEGILGDESCWKLLMREMLAALKRREADVLHLASLRAGSTFNELARHEPGLLCRDYAVTANTHWQMTVPGSMEDFYKGMSGKHRSELKRTARLLDKACGGKIQVKVFTDKEEVGAFCKDVEEVAKITYQRGLGAHSAYSEEDLRRLNALAAKRQLRAYVLYADGVPISFWYGFVFGETFYLRATGYDPRFKKYEPGTVLFVRMLEDVCSLMTARKIDFGFGDAFYKSRFGDDKWEEEEFWIFPCTARGVALNIARTVVVSCGTVSRRLMRAVKLEDRAKSIWRRMITPKHPDRERREAQ